MKLYVTIRNTIGKNRIGKVLFPMHNQNNDPSVTDQMSYFDLHYKKQGVYRRNYSSANSFRFVTKSVATDLATNKTPVTKTGVVKYLTTDNLSDG